MSDQLEYCILTPILHSSKIQTLLDRMISEYCQVVQ